MLSRRVGWDGGKFTRKDFNCPTSILAYTQSMGGVDRADQYARYYLPDGLRWNTNLIFYLLQVSVVNSLILMKNSQHQSARRMTLIDFFLDLVEGLLQGKIR